MKLAPVFWYSYSDAQHHDKFHKGKLCVKIVCFGKSMKFFKTSSSNGMQDLHF
jgi:hypothetical protein